MWLTSNGFIAEEMGSNQKSRWIVDSAEYTNKITDGAPINNKQDSYFTLMTRYSNRNSF